jgi:hypothetical protein
MFPTAPPAEGTPYGIYWPTTVPAALVTQTVHLDTDGTTTPVATTPSGSRVTPRSTQFEAPNRVVGGVTREPGQGGEVARVVLGTFVGARSGDKGGNANVGLWVRRSGDSALGGVSDPALDEARYDWLAATITPDEVRRLLPEAAALDIEVHPLPNLLAVNVVIRGWLGRGVADSTSLDPQAKGLGEHLRSRLVDVPVDLLAGDGRT